METPDRVLLSAKYFIEKDGVNWFHFYLFKCLFEALIAKLRFFLRFHQLKVNGLIASSRPKET